MQRGNFRPLIMGKKRIKVKKIRSIIRKLFKIMLLPVTVPIWLLIRLLRPWFLVRIQHLDSERIGHFAANTELYLCERDAQINFPNKPYIDLRYLTSISNKQLATMWKRELIIGPSTLLSSISRLNKLAPGGQRHEIGNNAQGDRDIYNLLDRFPQHLQFLPEEEERGQTSLRDMGIPGGMPFICLIVRDRFYLEKTYPDRDYSHFDCRNSSIMNYALASNELAVRGVYVIRMGAIVEEPLPISDPRVIDYATNGMRNDFLDIYLSAKCRFMISTGTGLECVPLIFRRNIVFTNFAIPHYLVTYASNSLSILKKFWNCSEHRFLTFRELFKIDQFIFFNSYRLKEINIEVVENTPEEIAAAVLEMEQRLNGSWAKSDADEDLQKRFWEIFPSSATHPENCKPLHGEIRCRIGAEYLRQNRALLD